MCSNKTLKELKAAWQGMNFNDLWGSNKTLKELKEKFREGE